MGLLRVGLPPPSPRLRAEGRSEGQQLAPPQPVWLPLTLTLSPQSGERETDSYTI